MKIPIKKIGNVCSYAVGCIPFKNMIRLVIMEKESGVLFKEKYTCIDFKAKELKASQKLDFDVFFAIHKAFLAKTKTIDNTLFLLSDYSNQGVYLLELHETENYQVKEGDRHIDLYGSLWHESYYNVAVYFTKILSEKLKQI